MPLRDLFTPARALTPPSIPDSLLNQYLAYCPKTKGVFLASGSGFLVVHTGNDRAPNPKTTTESQVRKALWWSEESLLEHVVKTLRDAAIPRVHQRTSVSYPIAKVLYECQTRLGVPVTKIGFYEGAEDIERILDNISRSAGKSERAVREVMGNLGVEVETGNLQSARDAILGKSTTLSNDPSFLCFEHHDQRHEYNSGAYDYFFLHFFHTHSKDGGEMHLILIAYTNDKYFYGFKGAN